MRGDAIQGSTNVWSLKLGDRDTKTPGRHLCSPPRTLSPTQNRRQP